MRLAMRGARGDLETTRLCRDVYEKLKGQLMCVMYLGVRWFGHDYGWKMWRERIFTEFTHRTAMSATQPAPFLHSLHLPFQDSGLLIL